LAKGLATRGIDLEPIDRLEEKLRLLVGVIERLRGEGARMAEENTRLSRELDSTRVRLTEVESATEEMAVLREERELIRTRVGEMLEQIEALNL
jgi:regulator of replication initiation timing